ncbi:MAG: cadherin-like beta sandwich domain-containing protein [Clostridiales bacterium]|nr:cadherin-like beta sandwich domain-containing protein [Clostridiales bacterium]
MNAKITRKLIAVCIAVVMVMQTATSALAYVGGTAELGTGSAEQAEALLRNLGLLDENGELNLSQSVMLDGVGYSLDEIIALLNDPATDLAKVGYVDGTPIALGDLKLMIEIEAELARIKSTYFSGRAFTDDQVASLSGLLDQISTQGISATFLAPDGQAKSYAASPPTFSIELAPGSPSEVSYTSPAQETTLTYNLKLEGDLEPGKKYGFSWKALRGMLPMGYVFAQLRMQNTISGPVAVAEGADVTVGDAESGADVSFSFSNFLEKYGVLTLTFSGNLNNQIGMGISGDLRGIVQFAGGDGLLFAGEQGTGDRYNLPFAVHKEYAFSNAAGTSNYSWSMSTSSGTVEKLMASVTGGYNETDNPRWYLVDYDDDTAVNNLIRMGYTAAEIYAGSNARFQVDAQLLLLDGLKNTGSGNERVTGYMKNALPVGYSIGNTPLATLGYRWNGNRVEATGNAAKPLNLPDNYDGTPYILIVPRELSNPNSQAVSIVMESTDGQVPYSLNTVWPGNPIYTENMSGNSSDMFFSIGVGRQRTVSSAVSVYNDPNLRPKVNAIAVPEGTYRFGEYVPITFEFNTPVVPTGMTVTINGDTVQATALMMGTTGRQAVAFYKVKDVDATTIVISNVSGLADLFGNPPVSDNNAGMGWGFAGVTLESALMKFAVTGVSASPAVVQPPLVQDGVEVRLNLSQELAFRNKYGNFDQSGGQEREAPFMAEASSQGTAPHTCQLYLSEAGDGTISAVGTITGLKVPSADEAYTVQIYASEGTKASPGVWEPVPGQSASFTLKAAAFVDGFDIVYPAGDKSELSLAETFRPKLGVAFSGSPTYTSGAWASSDPDIATIGTDGQVVLTNNKLGSVSFEFTADDGGLSDPDSSHLKAVTSHPYAVVAGDSPALVIPDECNRIVTTKGAPVEVRWSSNAKSFTSDSFVYSVELFSGELTKAQLAGATPIAMAPPVAAASTANSAVVPGDYLTEISVGGTPAYTIRVSMPHPLFPADSLSAVCYVIVKPALPVAHVELPAGGLYLLDSRAAAINWSIDNYEPGFTQGEFSVVRVSTQNGQDATENVYTQAVSAPSGSYTLTPKKASGLKDTYMVSLRAKNDEDAGYSCDSYPLYAYSDGALKLMVGGQNTESLSMDNEPKVSSSLPTATDRILALRTELALIEYIGVNYSEYNWSQLKDGIRWDTSDSETVSVNYKQGGLYEDLSRFSMNTYLPETQMALSSLKDGKATVAATHANTGMSASVQVDVKTLREKFYLFSLTPMQKTALTYTDGKGVKKTVYTNDEGVLALYEPNGIGSDVQLKSEGAGGAVFMGTYYQANLLSGERDATKLQLYPLNTFKLRQVAKVDIFLKKPDGSPYAGDLALRGGAYKNGGYCQDALLLGNAVPGPGNPLKDGKASQTVTIGSDGKLTVYMDSTEFWSLEKGEGNTAGTTLSPTDDMQYIFELSGMNGYFPLLIYTNGNITLEDIMRSAGNVTELESHAGGPQPFISNQAMDYVISGNRLVDVRKSTGHIGPNSTYPDTKLLTTALLWGLDPSALNYRLDLCDEFGYIPAAQQSKVVTYPFSSMPVVRNELTLSETTMTKSGWMPDKSDRGLVARLSAGGAMIAEQPVLPRAVDLTRTPKLTETQEITSLMVSLKNSSNLPNPSMDNPDSMTSNVLGLLGGLCGGANGAGCKMIITPGEDNSTFNAFIWAGYNSLGLDKIDYDSNGMVLDTAFNQHSLSAAPSLKDAKEMAKGEYEVGKTIKEAKDNSSKKKASKDYDVTGQLEGYFEAQIQYNFETGKWDIYVLGGGFTFGIGVGYKITYNQMVGPVPVTAEFELGGALQLDFKAALRRSEQPGLPWAPAVDADYVNDFLTNLRVALYVSAFAGFGFDYSVVALKVGLFGRLDGDFQFKFLSREYLDNASQRQVNGQGIQLSGTVGIKFVASFLFISYEYVLASVQAGYHWVFNDWAAINNYWGSAATGTGPGAMASALAASAPVSGLVPVHSSATMQSRSYLDEFARSWGSTRQLQTNAYPYAFPLVTEDGQLLLFVSDNNSSNVSDTRVFATSLSGDSYLQGSEIAAPAGFTGYGDSGLSLAGDKGFAAAAWVRQSAALPPKDPDQPLSSAEQALMMNGTEIVASVYDGSNWTSTRLTENALPDIAPVVATDGSGSAVAAWRSVYAGDESDLLDFSQQDNILYSIYQSGAWSMPRQLYNGTSGMVRGITAAMLPDKTAAVAYSLDTSGTGNAAEYEIGYAVVDSDGNPEFSAVITKDQWLNENPQLAVAAFATGDVRFVLGWHSMREGLSDIRMASFDADGMLSNSFPDSIEQVAGGSSVNIDGRFRFAKMGKAENGIENLSILWPQSVDNDQGEVDHGMLCAVKFMRAGNGLGISAALDVAELPVRTLIDHFDAYVASSDGTTIKAVIQGTEYKDISIDDPGTYDVFQDLAGNPVYVGKAETMLFTVAETYQNKVQLDSLLVDYADLSANALTPIQFTISNAGMAQIDSVDVSIGGILTTFDDLALLPNGSRTLVCWHPVGSKVENLEYALTAHFGASKDTLTGTAYLDYPDLGISKMKLVSEEQGIRTMQLTLYNASAATLAGGKHRSVHLGFYDDSLLQNIQEVKCSAPEVAVNQDKTLTVSGEENLRLIDEGAFNLELRFDIGQYVKSAGLDEIPDSGMRLFADAWITETKQGASIAMPEYYKNNNSASAVFDSLLIRIGQPVSLAVEQGVSGSGNATAEVTVRNNSLTSRTGGNVVATLIDAGGKPVETLQSYVNGAISLGGEESTVVSFSFSKPGSRVLASYGSFDDASDSNAGLSSLSFENLPVRLPDFTADSLGNSSCSVANGVAKSTRVSFVAENPGASVAVSVNGTALADANSIVALAKGDTVIAVEVTSKDGTAKRIYALTVNTTFDTGGGGDGDKKGPGGSSGGGASTRIEEDETPLSNVKTLQEQYADELYKLGLFLGTVAGADPPVYELDGPLTRIQALVLVVRLLGLEEEALAFKGSRQFTDVPQWAWQYAAFGYQEGITNGVNTERTLFAPDRPVTLQEFTAFLLRVLGYSEANGDFEYADALAKALAVKLYTEKEMAALGDGRFLRGDAVVAMADALLSSMNGADGARLIDTLVESELFTEEDAKAFAEAILKTGKLGD